MRVIQIVNIGGMHGTVSRTPSPHREALFGSFSQSDSSMQLKSLVSDSVITQEPKNPVFCVCPRDCTRTCYLLTNAPETTPKCRGIRSVADIFGLESTTPFIFVHAFKGQPHCCWDSSDRGEIAMKRHVEIEWRPHRGKSS